VEAEKSTACLRFAVASMVPIATSMMPLEIDCTASA
jgi:hypothetical protein